MCTRSDTCWVRTGPRRSSSVALGAGVPLGLVEDAFLLRSANTYCAREISLRRLICWKVKSNISRLKRGDSLACAGNDSSHLDMATLAQNVGSPLSNFPPAIMTKREFAEPRGPCIRDRDQVKQICACVRACTRPESESEKGSCRERRDYQIYCPPQLLGH